ncbi:hypothetical protein LCGC14_2488720, partial [marine sediment metagenome]
MSYARLHNHARVKGMRQKVAAFMDEHIYPNEQFLMEGGDDRESLMKELQGKTKKMGMWAPHLPAEAGGMGIGFMPYVYINEILGRSPFAPRAFGAQAPDSGNAEILWQFGTEEQKERWLKPLVTGEIRSCFSMTEPEVAGSDPTLLQTKAVRDGDEWVINGEKHYISGAGDPRCKIMIVMVKTDPDAARHQQQSQILVPMDTKGVEILRPMKVFSMDDAPHGHMHMRFTNVRVPKENVILGVGRGFEISQGRLGPGRIHHCMRALGMGERALEMLCKRSLERTAFGKPLANLGGNIDIIANARMDLDMARLLTLKAAHMMDTVSVKEARIW